MPWIPGSSSGSGGWTWVGDGVPDTPFPGSNTSYLDPTATTSDTDKPVEHGRVMLAVGEGPHAGLVNGLKSVYLNDVPVQNADGTLNFNDVSVAVVNGTLNQKPISGFEGAESEVGVGQKVLKATPIVRSISNTTATHARVKISVPSLQTIDTTTGKTSSAHLSYKIEVQPNGGSYQAVTLGDGGVIEKQFTSKLIKGYKFALPGTGPWNIRLTRLEVDSYSQYLQNDLYFESLATIIDGRYSYPMTACIAVACNANQFNSIPKITADWKARIISVPANYDPIARTYATTGTGTTAGTWDGTFKQAWSDNPAWVFYDMVTNNLFGCGLTSGAPDKFLLYQIAQYCDVMVSDGMGGTEPRFTCSVNIETQDEAIKALGYLASIFRGSAYWAGGAVVPVQDKDETPSAQFTNSNVVEGKFVYTSSAKPARHTACIVKYNDPNNNYELTPLLVQDNAGVARYGYNPVEVVAYGCASRGQASRLGLMTLTTELSQTEGISFSTALEAVPLRPGRIIKVHDAFRFGKRFGGRVMASTTTSVTLDAPVTLESGKTYQLSCTLPNGTVEVKPVSTGAGTVSTLAVSSAFSVAPQAEGQWILVANDFAPMLYRVLGIKEGSDGAYEITGLFHNPAKYTAVESGLILDALAAVPLAYHAPVTNLTLTESMAVQTDRLVSTLLASWTPVADITGYLAVASRDGGPWQPMTVAGSGATLADIQPGSWKVRVVARYATGDSTYTESAAYTTTGFQNTTSPAQAASSAAATAQNAASSAQTTANAAQASATTANNLLADIAADNKLTPIEKQQARREWDVIAAEKAGIDTQADTFGQSRATYDSAFQALATYLNAGTTWSSGIPSWISDANLATTTNITDSTFRSTWKAYYDARTALLNAIAAKAKALADAAQTSANSAATAADTAQTTANNAATAASNAQTSANTANTALADIAADNKLTPIEKHQARQEWDVIAAEKTANDTQATTFGITTEKTAYGTAFQALATYLNAGTTWSSGVPSWLADANLATTTAIAGSTFRSTWKAYYDARTTLLNAIAAKAKALADAAQTQANTATTNAATAQNGVNAINSGDALTNADKIALMESWKAELQTQTKLDASATSLAITTEKTAYDNAMTALSTGLIAAGAPSNWASLWPDGSTLAATGIMTSLSSWWATIAQKRTTLQVAISQAQSSAAQAAAISAAATDASSKVNTALTTAANDATAKAAAARTNAVNDINTAVAGMVSGATSAADAVSRVQAAASNAQSTANSASSAASTAQGSANSAASAASAAQATANSAASAASSAQSTANSAASAAAAAQTIPVFAAPANLPSLPSSSYPAKFGPVLTSSDWSLWKVNDAGSAWDRILFASTGIFGQLIASQIQVDDTLRAAIVDAAHVKTQLLTVLPDSTDTGNGTVQIGGGAIKARSILAQNLTIAGDNLIPNPNSEQAAPAGGWPSSCWETVSISNGDSNSYAGNNCRLLGASAWSQVTTNIPAAEGDQFYFEAQAKAISGGTARLRIIPLDGNGVPISYLQSATNNAFTYIKLSMAATMPAGTCSVVFVLENAAAAGFCWFDNLYARRMADANVIVDGTLQAIFARIARAIQSTNYAAGSAGNAPVGFCLSATPFTTTFKDGTTDSGCLMELGGSANFGGYKVATINTQLMTAINRIVNGTFWRTFSPWSAQPHFDYALTANPYTNPDYYVTAITASQNFNAPGYVSGTVMLKFTPTASLALTSGGGGSGSIAFRISVYLRNHTTGVETTIYQTTASCGNGGTWAPGQQSIDVTSRLSATPSGYGVAIVIEQIYMANYNGSNSATTTYTGTIDVTGFELVF